MKIKAITELSPKTNAKVVFVTCDFNVSLLNGKILNDTRIVEALPTIKYLRSKNFKVILASHLDRPKSHDLKFSLFPVANALEKYLKIKVNLIDYFWENKVLSEIISYPNDELILLENIRFYKGEKENNPDFAKHLSKMADIFVNDAFGASHRAHASIVGISQYLPSFAGLLLQKEILMLEKALINPKRPFIVFIGGAKTPEKISVIEKLLDIADTVCLGGAIANTFLAAWGFGMGRSLVDYEMVEMARTVFWKTTRKHTALILPADVAISKDSLNGHVQYADFDKVPSNVAIYDIGPKTNAHYRQLAQKAKTIIWNGPMGFYENKLFKKGTDNLLKDIASSNAFKIIGGGDTLTILSDKFFKNFDHVSTGGSAMLEFIKEGTLPGIEVLKNNN